MNRKGWRNVAPKWDVFPYGWMQGGGGEDIASIYFSKFLHRVKAIDIFKLFGCVKKVVEVVISP